MGAEFQAIASAHYDPDMVAETQWEYAGSPTVSFQWEFLPDGTSVTISTDPIEGDPLGGCFTKSTATAAYSSVSSQVDDKTVKVQAHVTGTILDYGPDGQKGTGDDALCGIDKKSIWLSEDLTSYELTVSPDAVVIMAGAKPNPVHRTAITAYVAPAGLTGTINFYLAIDSGQGNNMPATFSSPCAPLVNGQADTVLTSSNAIERIDVEVDYEWDHDNCRTTSVWSQPPECDWLVQPGYLEPDSTATVTVTLTLYGDPVPGHGITFRVAEVRLPSGEYVDEDLQQYAAFDEPSTVLTDVAGSASAILRAGPNVADCSIIYLAIDDNDVWH